MSARREPDRWRVTSIGLTALVFLVAALFGLIVLPYAQPDLKLAGIWDAICSAAGIIRNAPAEQPVAPAAPVSTVAMTSHLLGAPTPEEPQRMAAE